MKAQIHYINKPFDHVPFKNLKFHLSFTRIFLDGPHGMVCRLVDCTFVDKLTISVEILYPKMGSRSTRSVDRSIIFVCLQ